MIFNTVLRETEETAQRLEGFTALVEEPGSVSSTHKEVFIPAAEKSMVCPGRVLQVRNTNCYHLKVTMHRKLYV